MVAELHGTFIMAILVGCIGYVVEGWLWGKEVHPDFPLVTRSQWGARKAKGVLGLKTPVPYVVIDHSYTTAACYYTSTCQKAMKSMQKDDMDNRGLWDIGYNFAIGSEGVAYEGRGWNVLGAHSLHFNTISIGICLIGDWSYYLAPIEQMAAARHLIQRGVELGYIRSDYKLIGHSQVHLSDNPGTELEKNLTSWGHYSPFPASSDDLVHVPELKEDLLNQKKFDILC